MDEAVSGGRSVRLRIERRQHLGRVPLRLDLLEHVRDAPRRVDDERGAEDAVVLAAVHRLLAPDAVGLGDRVVLVGEQRERQRELVAKLPVRRDAVGRDAEHDGSPGLHVGPAVAELAGLRGAAARVVLRVEVEDDGPPAERRERHVLPPVRREREPGRFGADRGSAHGSRPRSASGARTRAIGYTVPAASPGSRKFQATTPSSPAGSRMYAASTPRGWLAGTYHQIPVAESAPAVQRPSARATWCPSNVRSERVTLSIANASLGAFHPLPSRATMIPCRRSRPTTACRLSGTRYAAGSASLRRAAKRSHTGMRIRLNSPVRLRRAKPCEPSLSECVISTMTRSMRGWASRWRTTTESLRPRWPTSASSVSFRSAVIPRISRTKL